MESVLMRADENEQQAVKYYKLAADQCYADAQKMKYYKQFVVLNCLQLIRVMKNHKSN